MDAAELHRKLLAIENECRDLRLMLTYMAHERGGEIVLGEDEIGEVSHLEVDVRQAEGKLIAEIHPRYPIVRT